MISKTIQLLKAFGYKIRFGRRFQFRGLPGIAHRASIKLLGGEISIESGFAMKESAYAAVVNGGKLSIGKSVSLGRGTVIICHDQIVIGDGCAIAPNVSIFDHDHRFGPAGMQPGYKTSPIIIEKNCWIGSGVTILRGTHIGEGCVIGAGCVVKGNIPAHSMVTSDRKLNIVPIEDRTSDAH